MKELSKATFGAGCFWCVEAVFQRLEGVSNVVSGYMGGNIKNPTYREISSGLTGHAEVIQFDYDPDVITYGELLDVLWATHNPTTLNQQGADRGTQYRSAIFVHNEDQRTTALESKMAVAPKYWDDPIVTEISDATTFYKGEPYHQNYFNGHKSAPYCMVVINPKLAKLRSKFQHKLKQEYV